MTTGKVLIAVAAICAVAMPSPSRADTYQFFVSGYPAANESYVTASAGTSLETATRAKPTAAQPLEARDRTWDETNGIALRSDKKGILITLH